MTNGRPDLLALTPDDLATLANRGLVKRAEKDLESGAGPTSFDVDGSGRVTAKWPDGAVVTLAPGAVLGDQCCTCAAFTICRHIIGTVFAYQRAAPAGDTPAQAVNEPWNPGAVQDVTLETYYKPAVFASIRKEWEAGVVAQVHVSSKPLARLHSAGVTLRFLVARDVRYVQCDCAEESPCRHVPLAVWSFRQLGAGVVAGLIAANQARQKPPTELHEESERLIANLFTYGVAALPPTDERAWEGLAPRLRRAGLIWPEQIVLEWLALRQQYVDRDARFDAADLVQRSGELLIRLRAICAETGTVPQLFLRGVREESNELGSARLIGLGTAVSVHRKSVSVTAMLQDVATGTVLSLRREAAGHDKSFHTLAQAAFNKKFSYAAAGSGQLLVKGAKRSLNGEVALSRAAVALNPQAYEWEKLRAPLLVESAEELRSHFENLPPVTLRPRHLAQTFYVIPVERVEALGVDQMSRSLRAVLIDSRGEQIALEFPFYTHGRQGFAKLQQALETKVKFVAGQIRQYAKGLAITPSAVIVETETGGRQMIQPWIDSSDGKFDALSQDALEDADAFARFRLETMNALGELLLCGVSAADPLMEKRWAALIQQGSEIGLERFMEPATALHNEMRGRRGVLQWDASAAVRAAVTQAVLAVFC